MGLLNVPENVDEEIETPLRVPPLMEGLVKLPLLASALVATAVAMLLNSVSISVPLTILAGLPEGNESFVAKFVDLV